MFNLFRMTNLNVLLLFAESRRHGELSHTKQIRVGSMDVRMALEGADHQFHAVMVYSDHGDWHHHRAVG